MKNLKANFIIYFSVITIAVCALYILAYFANLTIFTEDFFRSYIPKGILLGMCLLTAVEAVLLIAGNRKKQRKRWKKQNSRRGA